jgi:hypothetical protein
MAIGVKINGTKATEGFLITPVGKTTFPVTIALDGATKTTKATLRVHSATAQVDLSSTSISGSQTATLAAKTQSRQKNDISLVVEVGGQVVATIPFTAVSNPRLRFMGRYQARFATDNDFFNEPRGTDQGWMFALEGEPDFVPAKNNVPLKRNQAVGRVIRFHDPVMLRSHVAPIGVFVTSIEGDTATGIVECTAGDPIIGEKVALGPNTYYASNNPQNPADPPPFENWPVGQEPLECFEVHVGKRFGGKSKALTDRPQAHGFAQLTAKELSDYGIVPLNQFSAARRQTLLDDYSAMSPADRTGTPAGRNLATRIAHLGGSKQFQIPSKTPTLSAGWSGREIYDGKVNDAVKIVPGDSQLMKFFAAHTAFSFSGKFFNFHSDEQCARVDGRIGVLTKELLTRAPAKPGPLQP